MTEEHRKTDEVILTKLEGMEELWNEKFDRISGYMNDQKFINKSLTERLNVVELAQANQMGKIAIISVIVGSGITLALNWVMRNIKM